MNLAVNKSKVKLIDFDPISTIIHIKPITFKENIFHKVRAIQLYYLFYHVTVFQYVEHLILIR